jgi:ABC-type uncharacterized transport system auxiliary subunit
MAAVLTLGLIVVLAGCAVRHRELIAYHALEYPAPAKETNSPIPGTLMVYRFLPASSVDIDVLVISQSSGAEKPTLQHWEDNPAEMITELVVRDFDSSGLFEKTVDQLSTARYRYALEGTIRSFRGSIEDGKGKALLAIEATLTDFEARVGVDKNVLKKLYKIEVPTQSTKPDSIIKGLDLAVKEFSELLRNDIRAAFESKAHEAAAKRVPSEPPRSRSRTPRKPRK